MSKTLRPFAIQCGVVAVILGLSVGMKGQNIPEGENAIYSGTAPVGSTAYIGASLTS
jgi:hypothetical protein